MIPRFYFIVAVCAALLLEPVGVAARQLGVGLYGTNGHQLFLKVLAKNPNVRVIAVAAAPKLTKLPLGVKRYDTLDQLIADPEVELVSLCSPRRQDQAHDAIRCLQAGRHVYAEKPCALTEPELDEILAAAKASGKEFHEMAGTAFAPHYITMRRLVREGTIGEVIQVLVQKSYPYGPTRPQDEAIDGGMFLQVGIHAARMVEHVAGVRIQTIEGWETAIGKRESGDGKIAGAAQIGLENGGLATIVMNYLNPSSNRVRNNETLRIFGTKGFIESVDDGTRTRLMTASGAVEPLPEDPPKDYFDLLADHLVNGAPMPLTSEEELHPLRMLLRAKAQLRHGASSQPSRP